MVRLWNDFWFRPAGRRSFVATRVLLSVYSLWLLASRPDLPTVVGWPDPFWAGVPRSLALRFALTRSAPLEVLLYVLTGLVLLAAAFGVKQRITTIASGLLLYHFAPMEEVIQSGVALTVFRGFTVPVLGLLILGFATESEDRAASPEYRWPVAAVQFLMVLNYFMAGISKLHFAGWIWMTADNIRSIAMAFKTWGVDAPLAGMLIENWYLCAAVAIGTMSLELAFPLVLFSRLAAKVLVPLAFVGHILIRYMLGVFFPATPLLLVFIDWDWVGEKLAKYGAAGRWSREPIHLA